MRYLLALALLPAPAFADSDAHRKALGDVAKRDLAEMKRMLPGLYTNEEQVYFQSEMGLDEDAHLPRLTLTIVRDGDGFVARTLDPETGRATEARLSYRVEGDRIMSREERDGRETCEREFRVEFGQYRGTRVAGDCAGEVVADAEGFAFGDPATPFRMLRARAFRCWVSPRLDDGEYGFENDILVHDQGGRAWIEGEGHERVGIKMRNVRWPRGRNRDSLVLYAYRGEDEDTAVSYGWTGPEGDRLALNLRWVQASCTLGDADWQDRLTTSLEEGR